MRAILVVVVLAHAPAAAGQHDAADSLAVRAAELQAVLDRADTLLPEEAWNDTLPIDPEIQQRLLRVLAIPMADTTLERVTRHDFLGRARSRDDRLWIFNWYENTGGSFRSYGHVFYLHTADGRGIALVDDERSCDNGASFAEIHTLRSREHPGLYLAIGGVRGCASCCGHVAVVLQVVGDSLDLSYPAFPGDEQWLPGNDPYGPCHLLNTRCGDLLQWAFNEQRQHIAYTYRIDDLSPVPTDDGANEGIVHGTLQFDGQRFTQHEGPPEPER